MERQDVKVSVIIPAYNAAGVIRQAIESALKQDVNLEVIVINDCSPDQLDEVMRHYSKIPNVRYIRNRVNRGVAACRNIGVKQAKGEYVAFLDADDWWRPGKLKKQLNFMKKTNSVLCSTARELVDATGKSTGQIIETPRKITYKKLLYGNVINCSSVVMRRDVALEFPMTDSDIHEDYLTWLRILKKYPHACAINEPYLMYRLSPKGKSANKLKSARMTFRVYKKIGLPFYKACYYFVFYAFAGVKKHLPVIGK